MKASELPNGEYHSYYRPYIDALKDGELLPSLVSGLKEMEDFLNEIEESKLKFSYAEGKWTIAQVLLHLIDAERVFQYRALRFYRKDETPIPGFDQDMYILECGAEEKTKADIREEYLTVRKASIALFQSFKEEFLTRTGTASNAIVSVRALGFIINGHQRHHMNIIKERYLV